MQFSCAVRGLMIIKTRESRIGTQCTILNLKNPGSKDTTRLLCNKKIQRTYYTEFFLPVLSFWIRSLQVESTASGPTKFFLVQPY